MAILPRVITFHFWQVFSAAFLWSRAKSLKAKPLWLMLKHQTLHRLIQYMVRCLMPYK